MFEHLCDYLHDKLDELDRKVKSDGGLEGHELQCGDILAHFAKNLATYIAMEESGQDGEEISRRAYRNGESYGYEYPMSRRSMADGNMGGERSNRRGSSRRGYGGTSRADRMDDLVQSMGGAMDDMPDDLRREAQRFLDKMQQRM